ncbi:Ananain [Triticum urartu]|uniref:Ananain n=1 Tax=Triticum urartu TaxID=4572 RepID=M7ZQ34_TRIUA|nr:Ananain [Triticum urartu]
MEQNPADLGNGNLVTLVTKVVTSTITATVGEGGPLAVYGDSKFLQPKELFKAVQAPTPAPSKKGKMLGNPVAVGVEASDPDFRHYMSGVYSGSSSCGQRLNHAVTVVGYGADGSGQEYWVVKNQWGTGWGEAGYMRLSRGNGANCGIATYAYYPTMDS